MKSQNHRIKYREWIKRKEGCIYRINHNDRYEDRNWKQNLTAMREKIIDQYIEKNIEPAYMITRNYYYHQDDRTKVIDDNKRVNVVLDDLFNPRNRNEYQLDKDHFIERHQDQLIEDNGEYRIRRGGFHIHTLITELDDKIFTRPNRNIRKSLNHLYKKEVIPTQLVEEEGKTEIVRKLITHNLTRRCGFVGTGKKCIDIVDTQNYKEFDGYTGWKGLVSYCTKNMYNTTNIVEIYDHQNSNSLLVSK